MGVQKREYLGSLKSDTICQHSTTDSGIYDLAWVNFLAIVKSHDCDTDP